VTEENRLCPLKRRKGTTEVVVEGSPN